MLSKDQIQQYQQDGYLLLKGAIEETAIERLERGVANNPPLDGTLDPHAPQFPAPGRYTLACQCLEDPDLAFIVEHPTIVDAAEDLLNDQPKLTAYVIYDRTPGGAGLGAHHDYKRWRPVGSSMNWLFTIVPFCSFDDDTGPLYIAPGSHRLERIKPGATPCLEVDSAIKPAAEDFINPNLERGDLLLMSMHLWHKAAGNSSDRHRVGLFNKYAAASHPPATGYYLYSDKVAEALSPAGQNLLAVHSKNDITTTRALLTRQRDNQVELLLMPTKHGLQLPGGPVHEERAIPDWDRGNFIAPLKDHLRQQVAIEPPWLSYIGDYEEAPGLCRVYGYALNDNGFPVPYQGEWISVAALNAADFAESLAEEWLLEALTTWLDERFVRGKGLSQAQSRIDQFAY